MYMLLLPKMFVSFYVSVGLEKASTRKVYAGKDKLFITIRVVFVSKWWARQNFDINLSAYFEEEIHHENIIVGAEIALKMK